MMGVEKQKWKEKLKQRGYTNFVMIILSNLELTFRSNVHNTYIIEID